jgi:phosphoribosylcarboxyaminoimidazole (NCAIR) mutase
VRHWIVVGLRVIISGTGGTAHVPGMVADGHDTSTSHWCNLSRRRHCPGLYPSQLTVAIGHATNAGLLAVRSLSTNRYDLRQPMIQYPTENERNGRGSQ